MRAAFGLLLFLAAGCAGSESDIRRAEYKEFFVNFVRGKDRGVGWYTNSIQDAVTKPQGQHYQYKPPAHISNFLVSRAVSGLGGTKIKNSYDLALATDWLLYALSFDPTAAVRSNACEQLGRVIVRMPVTSGPPAAEDLRADQRINTVATDLYNFGVELRKGQKVRVAHVVERMRELGKETPPTKQAAQQMVRAFAIPPVRGSLSPSVRGAADEIIPSLVRVCILVALREVACGDPLRPARVADEEPLVRAAAAKVLARVRSPQAVDAVATRLADRTDPRERDADVRCQMLNYLGAVGGRKAFAVCVVRLDDLDSAVRYQAQHALHRMTDARVAPLANAWRAWLAEHPAWGE